MSFATFLGLAMIVAAFFYPGIAIGLIFFALFGVSSTRGTYWNAVPTTRASNYGNPYDRPK